MASNLENLKEVVVDICKEYGKDRTRLMDVVENVQKKFNRVSNEAMDIIASELSAHRVEVEGVVSFYAFLSEEKCGKIIIRVCDDIIDKFANVERIDKKFKKELGINFGETTPDGKITLEHTPCMGMCDQAPAALINGVVVTRLKTDDVEEIVKILKETGDPNDITLRYGDGNNAHPLIRSMVVNHIRKPGEVVFSEYHKAKALKEAMTISPVEVIREIKAARLRGRGGAGFPTGMKWEFTRGADGDDKVVICNADEGEPGTFKDRVILTERADLVFEGMTIAGYAIGAETGLLYLRSEYTYLKEYLEEVLKQRKAEGLLGKDVCGKKGFNFDIRIQMGAGAYICGEETALISSCEGERGDPKNRPPFPAQKGYLGRPTAVNNVETLCCIVKIIENGTAWFSSIGPSSSTGTKVFSVCGDCTEPGVYEYPFGISVRELLKEVGATNTAAVQIGGASGILLGPSDFDRKIHFDDLATGGSIMIFNKRRSILEVVQYFMDFFNEESCGYCTPCRVGNQLLSSKLKDIIKGNGIPSDLDYLEQLGNTVKTASRCGLGQTSANPILCSIKNFKSEYEKKLRSSEDGLNPTFNIKKALKAGEAIAGRKSAIFNRV